MPSPSQFANTLDDTTLDPDGDVLGIDGSVGGGAFESKGITPTNLVKGAKGLRAPAVPITVNAVVVGADGTSRDVTETGVLIDGSDNVTVPGDIIVTGTVDGVDVAALNTNAIRGDHAGEFSALPLKATPTAADHVLMEDAAAGNAKARAAWPTAGGGDVTAAANIGDNRLTRGDGGAKGIKEATAASLSNTDALSGLLSVAVGTAWVWAAAGLTYVGGLGTLLIGQSTPAAGIVATALSLIAGQGGAASGAAGEDGAPASFTGGLGGSGDATYGPGAGADAVIKGGNAGPDGTSGLSAPGGDVEIDPGTLTGEASNGEVRIGKLVAPLSIESGACPWNHAGKFTIVPTQTTFAGTAYTLDADDNGTEIYFTHATNCDVTIDSITDGKGLRVKLIATHATGKVTFVAGTAAIRKQSKFTLVSDEQYSTMYIDFKADAEAYLEGGLGLA